MTKHLRTSLHKSPSGMYHLRYRFAGDIKWTQMSLRTKVKSEAMKKRDAFVASSGCSADESIALLEARISRLKRDRLSSDISIDSAWKQFIATDCAASISHDSLCGYEAHWKSLKAYLESCHKKCLSLVTKATVKDYLTVQASTHSGNTIRKRVTFFSRMWKELSLDDVWDGAVVTKKSRTLRKKPLKLEHVRKMITGSDGEWKLLYAILAYTGLRMVDACMLSTDDVDFDRHVIELMPRKTKDRGSDPMVAKIGMHPALELALRGTMSSGYFLPEIASEYLRDKSSVSKRIQRDITEHAGLITIQHPENGGRGVAVFGAHSFRKALSDRMREAGVDPMVRLKIMGHKNTGDLMQTYSHVSDPEVLSAIFLSMPDLLCNNTEVIKLRSAQ